MIATIRKCKCGYEPVVLKDDLGERECKKCGRLMKIIAREKRK